MDSLPANEQTHQSFGKLFIGRIVHTICRPETYFFDIYYYAILIIFYVATNARMTIAGLVYVFFAWPRNGNAQRSESITVDPRENEIPRDDDPKKYPKPAYKFGYSVFDPITMDVKSQWEHRDGDFVKGAYSLLDPDGLMRIVEYIADDENGFRAYIRKMPFDDLDSLKKSPAESPSLEEPDALDAFRSFPQKPISIVKIAPQKSLNSNYREKQLPANKIKNNDNNKYSSFYNNKETKQFPKKVVSQSQRGQLYHLQSREKQKSDGLDFFFNGPPTSAPLQTYHNERPYDAQSRKPYDLRDYSNDGYTNKYQPQNALPKYQAKAPASNYQSQYSAAKSVTNNPKSTYQNEGQNTGRYQQEGQPGRYRQEGQPGRYRAEGQLAKYQPESPSGKYQTERAVPIKYEFENPETKYKPAPRQNVKPYVQRVEVLPNSRSRQNPWNQKLKTPANQQPQQEYRPEVTTIQRQKYSDYQTEAPSIYTEVPEEYKDFRSDFSPNSQFVSDFGPSELNLQPQPPAASYPYQYEPVIQDYAQNSNDKTQNSNDYAPKSNEYAQKPNEYAQKSNDYSDKASEKEYSQATDFQIPDISEFASEYGLEEPRGFSVAPNSEQEGTELMELNTPSALEDAPKPADGSSTNKPIKYIPHGYSLQQVQENQPSEKYSAQYLKTFIKRVENGEYESKDA